MPYQGSTRRRASSLVLKERQNLRSLAVSPICLGACATPETVPAAFDAGVNFFFLTADLHWPAYEQLRRGIGMLLERGAGIRDDIVVAVVSYMTQEELCEQQFHEVLDAVPLLKRIDVTLMGAAKARDFMSRRQAYGKHIGGSIPRVQSVGASFHERPTAAMAVNHRLVDIAYIRYNPGHRGAEADVFPLLVDDRDALLYNFKSTIPFFMGTAASRLGASYWKPEVTDYYRFVLARPEFDGILCSLNGEYEVRELADAVARGPLREDECAYLCQLAEIDAGRAVRRK
jgi:hypothetical protein